MALTPGCARTHSIGARALPPNDLPDCLPASATMFLRGPRTSAVTSLACLRWQTLSMSTPDLRGVRRMNSSSPARGSALAIGFQFLPAPFDHGRQQLLGELLYHRVVGGLADQPAHLEEQLGGLHVA